MSVKIYIFEVCWGEQTVQASSVDKAKAVSRALELACGFGWLTHAEAKLWFSSDFAKSLPLPKGLDGSLTRREEFRS